MTPKTMTHRQKVQWMTEWAARHGLTLELAGEVGFGRPCVGVAAEAKYPNYHWYDDEGEQLDGNGEVWCPPDAYHKAEVVAVLGRGKKAEGQLFEWLQWLDANGFTLETGDQPVDPAFGMVGRMLGMHRYARLVKRAA